MSLLREVAGLEEHGAGRDEVNGVGEEKPVLRATSLLRRLSRYAGLVCRRVRAWLEALEVDEQGGGQGGGGEGGKVAGLIAGVGGPDGLG